MFRLDRTDDDTFTLVSDDRNAENVLIGDAISECLPHLLPDFEDSPTDDEGLLRFAVKREDWAGLSDALSHLGIEGMVQGADEAEELVEIALRDAL